MQGHTNIKFISLHLVHRTLQNVSLYATYNLNGNVHLYLCLFTDLLLERVRCWVSPYGATDMYSHPPNSTTTNITPWRTSYFCFYLTLIAFPNWAVCVFWNLSPKASFAWPFACICVHPIANPTNKANSTGEQYKNELCLSHIRRNSNTNSPRLSGLPDVREKTSSHETCDVNMRWHSEH